MITKEMALKAKHELTTLLNNPNVSIGLSFGRKGYVVKVITQVSNIAAPKSALGVPIEIEITNKPIFYDHTT